MSATSVLTGPESWTIVEGDALAELRTLPDGAADCCVTSPPYWGLRDYGADGQLGLEPTPEGYVAAIVEVLREVRRVLRDDGTLWLNLGDSYVAAPNGGHGKTTSRLTSGGRYQEHAPRPHQSFRRDREPVGGTRHRAAPALKPKDLVGIPWRVAFALQADGWYLRQDIIWHKPNPMPESVEDRCTKAHEYVFLLSKSKRYYFDAAAISEPATFPKGNGNTAPPDDVPGLAEHNNRSGIHRIGARETRNRRDVWTIATTPFHGSHFAVMPCALAEPCILAGSREGGGLVIDPFAGAGTTGVVALRHGRRFIGIELSGINVAMARERIRADAPLFNTAGAEQ